jgi:hypothetical protein
LAASAMAFVAFFTFPILVQARAVRAYFQDWSIVFIEFSSLGLVLILLAVCSLSEKTRGLPRGDDPLSPP